MITYSTNMMGPLSMDWFRNNGFTETVTKILEHDSIVFPHLKKGDEYTYESIKVYWFGGRIDIRGTDYSYGEELSLPVMRGEDWYTFSEWLDTFETTEVWTLDQIVEEYEKTNSKIRWFEK